MVPRCCRVAACPAARTACHLSCTARRCLYDAAVLLGRAPVRWMPAACRSAGEALAPSHHGMPAQWRAGRRSLKHKPVPEYGCPRPLLTYFQVRLSGERAEDGQLAGEGAGIFASICTGTGTRRAGAWQPAAGLELSTQGPALPCRLRLRLQCACFGPLDSRNNWGGPSLRAVRVCHVRQGSRCRICSGACPRPLCARAEPPVAHQSAVVSQPGAGSQEVGRRQRQRQGPQGAARPCCRHKRRGWRLGEQHQRGGRRRRCRRVVGR